MICLFYSAAKLNFLVEYSKKIGKYFMITFEFVS